MDLFSKFKRFEEKEKVKASSKDTKSSSNNGGHEHFSRLQNVLRSRSRHRDPDDDLGFPLQQTRTAPPQISNTRSMLIDESEDDHDSSSSSNKNKNKTKKGNGNNDDDADRPRGRSTLRSSSKESHSSVDNEGLPKLRVSRSLTPIRKEKTEPTVGKYGDSLTPAGPSSGSRTSSRRVSREPSPVYNPYGMNRGISPHIGGYSTNPRSLSPVASPGETRVPETPRTSLATLKDYAKITPEEITRVSTLPLLTIFGGAGAQTTAIVRYILSQHRNEFRIRVMTRNVKSPEARELSYLGGAQVQLKTGDVTSEFDITMALNDASFVFVNLNSFAMGEKSTTFWGMRIYELSLFYKVKHFIWSSEDYATKLGNFDPNYRCGHYDAKARVGEWLLSHPKNMGMIVSVLVTSPYLETFYDIFAPRHEPDGLVFYAPLGHEGGYMPMLTLEDLPYYVVYIFNHPKEFGYKTLKVATCEVNWNEVARIFSAVTRRSSKYKEITVEEFMEKLGYKTNAMESWGDDPADPCVMSANRAYKAFFRLWKERKVVRDYYTMNEIYPERIRTLEHWMKVVCFDGAHRKSMLKDINDGSISVVLDSSSRLLKKYKYSTY